MRRRTLYDPLQPMLWPTWLVTMDNHRFAVSSWELAPGADLRALWPQLAL